MTFPALPGHYSNGDTPSADELNQIIDAFHGLWGPIDARYEQAAAQTMGIGDTKVRFDTAIDTTSYVTPSGTGNTDFLLGLTGLWRFSTAIRYPTGTSGDRYLFANTGTTISSTTTRFGGDYLVTANAGILDFSTEKRITAGTSVHIGYACNVAMTTIIMGGTTHLALTWVRP